MRIRSFGLALIAALMIISAAAPAALAAGPGDARRFDTWTGYDVGRYPVGVAARDFNADGFADAAWIRDDFFDPSVSVQLNLGDGTLGAVITYPVTEQSTAIDSGDLDRDGDIDLVVIGEGYDFGNATIDLYLNDGAGDFTHTTTQGGEGGQDVVVAELTGDLDPDIALTSYGAADFVAILEGDGDGSFQPATRVVVGPGAPWHRGCRSGR